MMLQAEGGEDEQAQGFPSDDKKGKHNLMVWEVGGRKQAPLNALRKAR